MKIKHGKYYKNYINICINCNIPISPIAKRCHSCHMKNRMKNPKNSPTYIDGRSNREYRCIVCNKKIYEKYFK